ncbi:hypothetical protein C2G38_2087405, partial [Gigaspora rosea]
TRPRLNFRVYSRRFSSGRNSTVLELTPASVTYTQKYTSHAILSIKKYIYIPSRILSLYS